MTAFLGIDVGTQSVKVVAYDVDRRCVAQSVSVPLQLIAREDGSREQWAHSWIEALRHCVAQLEPELTARVAGIGVSGQQHGFVPVDRSGEVLGPVKLWCDTSTVRECDEITAAAGGAASCIELAGNCILPGYTASKVRWFKRTAPESYARMSTMLLPHDYVNFFLTGERFTECGDASGTGWFDVRRRTWSARMLAAIDNERDLLLCMPQLLGPAAGVPLAPTIAESLGLPRNVLVSVGGGDNMMAAIGTRNLRPGRLTLSLGTSGTLFAYSQQPIVDAQGDIAAFCDSSGAWLPLICTMNCTIATEQIRKLAGISLADTDALLANTVPGAAGIITLPFYNGERTPNLPHVRASIVGLDLGNTSAANLLRSAMEGATYGLRYGAEKFARLGMHFDSVCMTGGGAASRVWRQIVADVFRLPVYMLELQESAALGAALQSVYCYQTSLGSSQSLADLAEAHLAIEPTSRHEPHAQASAQYDDSYRRYIELVNSHRHSSTQQASRS